jgi:hypothetical protein
LFARLLHRGTRINNVIGTDSIWTDKYPVTKADTIPQSQSILDRHVIVDGDTRLNEGMVAILEWLPIAAPFMTWANA